LLTYNHIHNEYARAWLQFGVVGLGSFLYIIYTFFRYRADDPMNWQIHVILGLAVFSTSFIVIFVEGTATILTVVLLTSLTLNRYQIHDTAFRPWSAATAINYAIAATAIELISWVS
jgi:hypothetical protein